VINDQQLGDAFRQALREPIEALSPPADLADRIIRQRRSGRRRTGLAGTGVAVAALAITIAVILGGHAPGAARLGSARLRVASYTFKLPRGAHAVAASAAPAACAIGAYVVYTPGAGGGTSTADQPTIAQAVTSNGGCVSMLLTNPYTPGAADAPREAFPVVDQHAVQIGSDPGTVGTYEIVGGPGLTFNGVPVPSGTRQTVLNLQISASGGLTQDLQVAVAGISEQQLVSIVSSGLTSQPTNANTSVN
jgi:hypothetical protein